jgi:hypothetical protein
LATGELYRNAANNQLLLRDTKLIQVGLTSPLEIPGVISWFAELVNGGTDRATLSDGANINQWDDKSGNANHAATKKGQPTYVTASDSIYFDTTSCLGSTSKKITPANSISTVFIVAKADKTYNNSQMYFWFSGSDNAHSYNFVMRTGVAYDAMQLYINATAANIVNSDANQAIMSLYTIKSTDGKSANVNIWRNGSSLSLSGGSTGTMTADNTFAIGGVVGGGDIIAYYQHQAYVKEIITYNWALSSGDISKIETYLNNKYSLY